MRDCVIVPTYKRDDLLWVCLEAIRAANPLIPIHVFPDRGTSVERVCAEFDAIEHLTIEHSYHGNSYNVMEAMKWAYQAGFEVVYVIEDDAIIHPSFFEWSRSALESHTDAFAACGWQYSPNAIIGDGPDLLMPWYLSVCAAIPRKSLYKIVQHARVEYYAKMKDYLAHAYPTSHRRHSAHFEQDGLVLRVCEGSSQRCVWPRRPRATHIGFTGYHMPGKPLEGTLEERVALLKLALKDPVIMKRLMAGGSAPEMAKCRVCGKSVLTVMPKASIMCVECFHAENPDLPVTAASHYYFKPLVVGLDLDRASQAWTISG